MKKVLFIIALVTMIFVSCNKKNEYVASDASSKDSSASATEEQSVTLVYAEVNPLDTIVGQTGSEFKRLVEELSEGTIKIDLQAGGVLGSENDVLDAIVGGSTAIDMSRLSAFALTNYGGYKSKLLSIPYTFTSRDHWWKFANSDFAAEFLDEAHELGLPFRGICYGEEGFRHFFVRNGVNVAGLKDFAGLKLRVSNDPVMTGMVKGLGASATVVAFGELYSALQTGVVDGAEQPIANYRSNAFPEVANTLILDGHTLGAIEIVITDNAWAKLSKRQQDAVLEAGRRTQDFNAKLSQSAEDKVLEQLRAEGCTVIDVPNKAEWQTACEEIVKSTAKGQEALYQKLLDFGK